MSTLTRDEWNALGKRIPRWRERHPKERRKNKADENTGRRPANPGVKRGAGRQDLQLESSRSSGPSTGEKKKSKNFTLYRLRTYTRFPPPPSLKRPPPVKGKAAGMAPLRPPRDTAGEPLALGGWDWAGTPGAPAEEPVSSPGTPMRKQNTEF